MSPSCKTNVLSVHAQIISSQFVFGSVRVQAAFACHESSKMLVFLAGGYQEPGQDCAAGCCSPGPHGGGESPAAGQQLSGGHGWRWRRSVALHCLRVRVHAVSCWCVRMFWQIQEQLRWCWMDLVSTRPLKLQILFYQLWMAVGINLFAHISSFRLSNQAEVTQLLLRKGANVNLLNNSMCTALHIAVNKGFTDVVRVLTEHSADVNIQVRTCDVPHSPRWPSTCKSQPISSQFSFIFQEQDFTTIYPFCRDHQ